MKVLMIHTYYQQRGGEDVVFEKEAALMEQGGMEVRTLIFQNHRRAFLKFLLLPFNPLSFLKTIKAIKAFRPDVIHVHNWFFGASLSVFWAARIMKVPVVHTLHNFRILCPSAVLYYNKDLYLDSVSRNFPWGAVKRKLYRHSTFSTFWLALATRLHHLLGTWKGITRYIALTEGGKQIVCNSYLKLPANQVAVKGNFFSNGHSTTPVPRTNSFLFIGRLTEEKGISVLVEAFREGPYRLILIGDGPLAETVSEAADASPFIEYRGFQSGTQIEEALTSCSALIVPSLCYEPFGLVLIEAFANRTPVLAARRGAPADLVQDGINGFHFEPNQADDLREKLAFWASLTPETKDNYARHCLESYQTKYTAPINHSNLLNIYLSVKTGPLRPARK